MRVVLFVLILFVVFGVHAGPSGLAIAQVQEFVSEHEEPLEDWLVRIAPQAMSHTRASGHEVCAVVAQNDDGTRFGMALGSSAGAMTCLIDPSRVPAGMRPLRLTFHTHPEKAHVFPSHADEQYFRENPLPSGRAILRNRPERILDMPFSENDYRAGPGYVVSHGVVFFQAGQGSKRQVGKSAQE